MLEEAILQFNKALTTDTNQATVYYNRGIAYGKQGKLEESIADFTRAVAINPNNAKVHFNLGISYYGKGMRDQAVSHFNRAIAIDSTFEELYRQFLSSAANNQMKPQKNDKHPAIF